MTKKTIYTIIAVILAAGLAFLLYTNVFKPEPETAPQSLTNAKQEKKLVNVSDVIINNGEFNAQESGIDSPNSDKSVAIIDTKEFGPAFKEKSTGKVIPIGKVIQGEWTSDDRLLIIQGEIVSDFTEDFQLEQYVTGEKGVYLYDFNTQISQTLYQPTEDKVPLFQAIQKDDKILLNLGTKLVVLSNAGEFEKTIYNINDPERIVLSNQEGVEKNKVKFLVNTGKTNDEKVVSF